MSDKNHDSVIIKNIYEGGMSKDYGTTMTDYIATKPTQIKLYDRITFDDKNNIIPIVKRDNFRNPDIRYKQGGILKEQKGKALRLASKIKPLTHTNNFSGVENLSKEAIGFGGARPNLGLQIKQTEDRSKELIKIFDEFAKQNSLEARREAFMQERFGKSWNDLSELEQY